MLITQLFISKLAGPEIMSLFIVVLCIYLYSTDRQKDCDRILFSACIAMSLTYTIKLMTHIPKPVNALIAENDFRFPSGHATMAAVVSCLAIYYIHTYVKSSNTRKVLYVMSVCWFLIVSYSRVYLGVHILVDIVVGGFIGFLVTMVILKMFKHLHYYK